MDASVINDSDPEVLQNLKLCPELSEAQIMALNARLSNGMSPYKAPESWNDGTLEDLGPLAFYINRSIWNRINAQERVAFFRSVSDAFDGQSAAQKEKTRLFLRTVGPNPAAAARSKRATEECQSGPITASTLEDPLFIILYDSAGQFDACLDNEVLRGSLATLLEQPLPNDYLTVTKRKLDEIYPNGVPEDQLRLLGFLAHQYNAEEIRRWNVTSSDTLAALLNPDNGAWDAAPLRELVARYLESGGTLTSPILDLLGGVYLCYLGEDELQQINPEAIRNAEKLDISTCSQSKKDLLYGKASTAFAPENGTSPYYSLIQPYLGGASAEDLKNLARSQVDMDITTFLNLNPEEIQALSVQDVQGLLGVNLPDLKGAESNPSVAGWIRRQYQSDLDTLRIGLTGGMPSPSPTRSGSDRVNTSAASPFDGTVSDTFSNNVTELIPVVPTDGTPLFEITTAAASPSVAPTVPAIDAVPKVDLPTDISVTSSDVPLMSNETITDLGDVTDTTVMEQPEADTNSTTDLAITMNATDEFPTEIPATSFSATEALSDTIGETPSPVTGIDIEVTTLEESGTGFNTSVANGTALPSFTVEANATMSSNDTMVGIPVPFPTTVENTGFANITDVIDRTSFPPVVGDSNVTTDTNATVMPTPSVYLNHTSGADITPTDADNVTSAMRNMTIPSSPRPPGFVGITDTNTTISSTPPDNLNYTLSVDATTASSDNVTSPKFSVTEISSQRPPVVVGPVPNATILSSSGTTRSTTTVSPTTAKAARTTQRATSRVPLRTRPPWRPTPNGLINVEPAHSLASNASLSWVLLTLSLAIGFSIQKRFL
nr:mesothelin-like protein [Anolis sagrei ordinatus]